jgi:hypothetical protein
MLKKSIRGLAAVFLCWIVAATAVAAEPPAADLRGHDVLVYKDGDRVQGHIVEQTAETIVFQSERFGILRVPVGSAVVIKSAKPAEPAPTASVHSAPPASPAGNRQAAADRAEAEKVSVWDWFSPAVLTAKVANYFGPWHGKVAFSTEVVSDETSDRNNVALETQLQRKWKSDEVQLKARYDYSKTNELTTTDMIKADGLWRHDFPKGRFALYRPTLEWNRASFDKVTLAPNDYVLLQQEIGAGLSLISKPSRQVRVGVSENLFDLWNTVPSTLPDQGHSSRAIESAFEEVELKLPWRMSLSQRAVYYYSIASGTNGWENRIELSKKFTETFSTSIRHEIRRDNPDGRAPDYTRLKLLFGLDF